MMARRRGSAQNEAGIDKSDWEPTTLKLSPQAATALKIQSESARLNMGVLVDLLIRQAMPEAMEIAERVHAGLRQEPLKPWTLGPLSSGEILGSTPERPNTQQESHPDGNTSNQLADSTPTAQTPSKVASPAPAPVTLPKPRTSAVKPKSPTKTFDQSHLSSARALELSGSLRDRSIRFAQEVFEFYKQDDLLELLYGYVVAGLRREGETVTEQGAVALFKAWMRNRLMPRSVRNEILDCSAGFQSSVFDEGMSMEEFRSMEDY